MVRRIHGSIVNYFLRSIATLPRSAKRGIMLSSDAAAVPFCAIMAVWLITMRLDDSLFWLAVIVGMAGIITQQFFGFYRSIVRFMGLELVVAAFQSVTALTVALSVVVAFDDGVLTAARVGIVFWPLALVYVVGSRMAVRLLLRSRSESEDRVVIYGAGEAGVNLASAVLTRDEFKVIGFIDDNPSLQGAYINGLEVYSPSALDHLIKTFDVSKVLLAMPSVNRRRRHRIINRLEKYPVHVQTMPDVHDLISGRAHVDDITDVDIVDLLGRDVVPPVPDLLDACIRGKSVLVTGAGGSIGSELCLQIAQLGARRLILLELSEASLYVINQRLVKVVDEEDLSIEVIPLIGSVHHKSRMLEVFRVYGVDTVYHAAAYKHVPLVEHNMIEGVHNNIFGTLNTAEAAGEAKVRSFVLVSTDKAVKPTNVMGATKRFAELVLQGLGEKYPRTTYSMVRFGNVLESSGSVVPLFREQIRAGGPVTVTHPDIFRYFMTIPEAALLVLQAGSMAQGGDVFVLDMGEPVRITDLAAKMIHLMGLSICDEKNPEGDIEIQFTGLRPAEKLYEELLVGDNVAGTEHRRIMRAEESGPNWNELRLLLDRLLVACDRVDCQDVREILLTTSVHYSPTGPIEDLVWCAGQKAIQGTAFGAGAKVTHLEHHRAVVPLSEKPS